MRDLFSKGKEAMFMDRALEREILWCYNHFWKGFRNLKHLELTNKTCYSWFILKEINSSPLFLSQLKTLKLYLEFYFKRGDFVRSRNVLHELTKNEQFLQHLTHLDCEGFEGFQYYDRLMSELLCQCMNLVSLNFPIGRQADYYSSPDEIYKECQEIGVLEQIRKMNTLQTLSVSVYGIKTFIKHFSLPKSLQKIVLSVLHSFYDPALLDLFNSDFFERWGELSHLITLKIRMRRTAQSNDLLHKFVLPLLQETPSLKKFRLRLVHSPAFRASSCEALDLSLFNERVAVLKQLESFKVSNRTTFNEFSPQKPCQLLTFDSKRCQFLSNLKKVHIEGDFSQEFNFQSFLRFCSSSKPLGNKNLKLSILIFESIEAFSECIRFAKQAVSFGNLKLDLKILLLVQNLEETLNYFKQPIVLEKDLRVRLDISMKWRGRRQNVNSVIEPNYDSLKQIFGDFQIKITEWH